MTAAGPGGVFADEELAAFVAAMPPFGGVDVATVRAGIAERAAARGPGPDLPEVRDLDAGGVPCRLYRPAAGPLPLLVWLHAGGWTVGSVASHDRALRRLAAASGLAVLGVDYRLAPEHPWPASVEDTVTVLRWAAAELRPPGLAVGGDSAGGTLAALACLRLRDGPELPDLHVLVYASTDLTGAHPSMTEKASGFGLDADTVRFFNRQWVPDESRWGDPGVSPLHVPDLTAMPAALVVSCEHDPLRDESEAYAQRLRDAGVPVTARREPGMIHNFLLLDQVSPACAVVGDRLARDVAAFIGER